MTWYSTGSTGGEGHRQRRGQRGACQLTTIVANFYPAGSRGTYLGRGEGGSGGYALGFDDCRGV